MNQVFDQLFNEVYGSSRPSANVLPVDVLEHEDKMIVRASVPGMHPENIDVSIEDNVLTLKGETHSESEHKEAKVYRREISTGSFTRSIRLPEDLDLDNANAEFSHGLMTITIPRQEKPRRTIKVQVNNPSIEAEARDESEENA
jgi:HSP20 family protein